jgi:hypothetical protein
MDAQPQKGWPLGAVLALALLGPPLAAAALMLSWPSPDGDKGSDAAWWLTALIGIVIAGVAGWKSPSVSKRVTVIVLGVVSTAITFVACFFWMISGG